MGAPLTEDWYFCPTCGAKVQVGSDGCQTCTTREQHDIDFEYPTRESNGSLAHMHADGSERIEDFEYDEFIMQEFHRQSRTSLTPVVIALALAVFLVVIFLILATMNL